MSESTSFLAAGGDLLPCLRNYVMAFPCRCEEGDGGCPRTCLTCRAEDMIEIISPPPPIRRGQALILTLYSPAGHMLYSALLTSTEAFEYLLESPAQVGRVKLEFR